MCGGQSEKRGDPQEMSLGGEEERLGVGMNLDSGIQDVHCTVLSTLCMFDCPNKKAQASLGCVRREGRHGSNVTIQA